MVRVLTKRNVVIVVVIELIQLIVQYLLAQRMIVAVDIVQYDLHVAF